MNARLSLALHPLSRRSEDLSCCSGDLSCCSGDLSCCSGDLSCCSGDLSCCSGDLSCCSGELSCCSGDLSCCSGELSCCSGELSCCSGDLSRCSGELSCCSGDLSRCSEDLSCCSGDLSCWFGNLSCCFRGTASKASLLDPVSFRVPRCSLSRELPLNRFGAHPDEKGGEPRFEKESCCFCTWLTGTSSWLSSVINRWPVRLEPDAKCKRTGGDQRDAFGVSTDVRDERLPGRYE
jgi:hypothetical protein